MTGCVDGALSRGIFVAVPAPSLVQQSHSECPCPPARDLAPTKSCRCSAPVAWARCTRRATRDSTARSRSRSCPTRSPAIRSSASASTAKPAPSRSSRIRTSAPCTTSGEQEGHGVSRHGVPRRRDAGRPARERRAARSIRRSRSAIEIASSARQGASRRHRPSRSEARQHHAHEERARSCWTSVWRKRARHLRRRAAASMPTTPANLTEEGTILGTFQYMAPEQFEGNRQTRGRTSLRSAR